MYRRLQPILYVRDVAAEAAFYRQLGFTIGDESAGFASVAYGEAILFGLQAREAIDPRQVFWQIGVASVSQVEAQCRAAGLACGQPELQEWGEWLLVVATPNGYQLWLEGPP